MYPSGLLKILLNCKPGVATSFMLYSTSAYHFQIL
jgi:hypothetical protein